MYNNNIIIKMSISFRKYSVVQSGILNRCNLCATLYIRGNENKGDEINLIRNEAS